MRVQLSTDELYPYYEDWHGFGTPDFDLDVPDELFHRYAKAKGDFFTVLNELKGFLGDP